MRVPFAFLSVAFSALSAIATASPARANCYETFGCTDSQYFDAQQLEQASCQVLWEMRNIIFKERGYCFHSTRAVKAFGNAGCLYDDVASVPRNDFKRANVSVMNQPKAARAASCAEAALRPEKSTVSGPGSARGIPASVVG